jgi:hypothetical protein
MAGAHFQNSGSESLQEGNYINQTVLDGRAGRHAIRWLDSVEEYLKTVGVRNWRRKSHDRDQWRAVVKEAKVHHELQSPQRKKKFMTPVTLPAWSMVSNIFYSSKTGTVDSNRSRCTNFCLC